MAGNRISGHQIVCNATGCCICVYTHTCTHTHIVTSQVRRQLHIIILHLLVMLAAEKGVANGTKHKLYTEMFECESDHSRSMH